MSESIDVRNSEIIVNGKVSSTALITIGGVAADCVSQSISPAPSKYLEYFVRCVTKTCKCFSIIRYETSNQCNLITHEDSHVALLLITCNRESCKYISRDANISHRYYIYHSLQNCSQTL